VTLTSRDLGFLVGILKPDFLIVDDADKVKMTDVVLAASGTATLLVGLLEKPMNIMYRMNAITAYLAKRFNP
jgi:lipid-A-disaccharide synthase